MVVVRVRAETAGVRLARRQAEGEAPVPLVAVVLCPDIGMLCPVTGMPCPDTGMPCPDTGMSCPAAVTGMPGTGMSCPS